MYVYTYFKEALVEKPFSSRLLLFHLLYVWHTIKHTRTLAYNVYPHHILVKGGACVRACVHACIRACAVHGWCKLVRRQKQQQQQPLVQYARHRSLLLLRLLLPFVYYQNMGNIINVGPNKAAVISGCGVFLRPRLGSSQTLRKGAQ